MKSLDSLIIAALLDAGSLCRVVVDRDVKTVRDRFEDEGESFLTITLPRFAKSLEQALAAESLASVRFPNFKSRRGYPCFLRGFLKLVFDESTYQIRSDPDPAAIQAIRQICLLASKLFEVCDPRRQRRSFDAYVQTEEDVQDLWFNDRDLKDLRAVATQVFGRQLAAIDSTIARGDHYPTHGPGATADRLRGNAKYDSLYWPDRLEAFFPSADFLLPGYSYFERLRQCTAPQPRDEQPVRVITVPKTAEKARIIAMEPATVQYAQQSVLREFATHFRSGRSEFITLDSQDRNRQLARIGSADGSCSTIDLSDASDRISVDVVSAVFGNYPNLLGALLTSRSTTASLPDGRRVWLRKFASMGSATCFPVESVVFATIALNAVRKELGRSALTPRLLRGLAKTTRVFGDDIIVPARFTQRVLADLVSFGMRPNPHKSFWTGRFRESCGGDYFAGEDVGVFRLRQRLPRTRHDAKEVLAAISFRNHAYQAGYWRVARLIDERVAKLRLPMPIVEPTSSVVGRVSVFSWRPQRHHPDYQSPLVKGIKVRTAVPVSRVSDSGALLKCLLPGRFAPFADVNHLTHGGRPDSVSTIVGWGSPF